jgi:hypothetical protein
MYDNADTSTGGDYETGWHPAHAEQCEYGLTQRQDKYAWTPVFRFDSGPNAGKQMTTTMAISEFKNDGEVNTGGTAKLYRQLGALGVPVGEKFGDPPGSPSFWQLGWTGEQVAAFMVSNPAPVQIQVYYDDKWGNFKVGGIRRMRGPGGAPVQAPQAPQQAPAPAMGGYQPGPPAPGYAVPGQPPAPAQGYPPQQAPAPAQGYQQAPPQYQAGPPPQGAPQPVQPPQGQGWQPAQAAPPQQGIPPQHPMSEFQPGTTWNPAGQQAPPPQQAAPPGAPPQQAPAPMPPNGMPPQQGQVPGQPPQQGGVAPPPWKQ